MIDRDNLPAKDVGVNMDNVDKIIHKIIKEFRSELSNEEVEEGFDGLKGLYSDYFHKNAIEPLIIMYYQVNGSGESYSLSYRQYNFVKNLEVILKNQPKLSLKEVVDFMEKVISFDINNCHGIFEAIFESRPDVEVNDAINFIKGIVEDGLYTKFHSFLGHTIFKVILELNSENSLEEVGKQFSEIVNPYFLNVSSQENESALAKICVLCREGNIKDMLKFEFSDFDLDQDSAGVLKALLQYCIDHSNQEIIDYRYGKGVSDFTLDSDIDSGVDTSYVEQEMWGN